jgi:hypothetical protein
MGTRLRGHQYAKESNAKLVDQQPVARTSMQKPPLDPDVSDTAPSDPVLIVYDEKHLITYLRLLDADAEGADWREVASENSVVPVLGFTRGSSFSRLTSARALGKATSKLSTRKNKRRPLPGLA